MPPTDNLVELPDDNESLKAMVRTLLLERRSLAGERDGERGRADDLHIENLRLRVELDRYKKWYYGPRADRLQSTGELAQMLLGFAETLDRKPVNPDDMPPHTDTEEELRRVRRHKGRRHLTNFENLPVTTHVYELSPEERVCPCCGVERKEIGQKESWQIDHIPGRFERIHHVRKKYAPPACETNGNSPSIETAAKPETAIDKGLAGPGLLAYIVTSKFNDYLTCYRLEDIFARQGFKISRATQSVWCGDAADLVEPLYELMADRCGPRTWWPPTTPSCPC